MTVEGHNFQQLKAAILALSQARDWEVARKEWTLVGVHDADEPETCLCGHFPIIEICEIRNRVTGRHAEVGNRCVRRFLGFRSDLIFAGVKRIRRDLTKSLNADAIAFFRERGLLSAWEYTFSESTLKKRLLSATQMESRMRINQKVLAAVKNRGFQGPD